VQVIALVAYVALSIFILIMWVRLIFDFVVNVNRGWRPRGVAMVIAEVAFTVTDPPIRLVRRFVPPLRVGAVSLDFAWTIVMLTAIILSYVVAGFRN
jgi:YggT family protein